MKKTLNPKLKYKIAFTSFGWETISIICLVLAFLLFNIATSLISVYVTHDEVMFTDPAANLYLGKGFTSTAWEFQTREKFWAGNSPLYTILLANWMQFFGFSIISVRSLNYVLMIIAGLLLWLGVIRLNLVTSSWSRVGLIAVLFLADGIALNYRTGRYDVIQIILCAASLLVCSIPSTWLRCVLLSCIGIFLPIAGLNLLTYAVLFCGLLLIYLRRWFVSETVSLAIGSIVGISFLYIFYSTNGVWKDFAISTALSGQSFVGKLARAILQRNFKYIAEYKEIFTLFFRENSFFPLLVLAIGLAVYQMRKGKFKFRSLLSFGLATSFCIPVGVFFLGKYPYYYVWMAFIPLAICVFSTINPSSFNRRKWSHWLILGVLVLTCLVGLPRQVALANWKAYDYAPVEALIEKNVTKKDWVFCEYEAYYAAKKRAAEVFLLNYTDSSFFSSIPEKEKISVLIIKPSMFEEEASRVGGNWYDTGNGISLNLDGYIYPLQVYRRKGNS